MADLDLSAVAAARTDLHSTEDELRQVRLDLVSAQVERDRAQSLGDRQAAARADGQAARSQQRLDALLGAVRTGLDDVRHRADDLVKALQPEQAVASLSAKHPVLMVPVRLETRFFDNGNTLKVRIFPDQAHVTAHDPALTTDEIEGLTWYWTYRWPHRDASTVAGKALADEAWSGLVQRFRPGRAAFVVRRYPPTNLDSTQQAPSWADLPVRAGEWSTAARVGLLPDRWCVVGFRRTGEGEHQEIFRTWGTAVPDRLGAGPTPDPGAPDRAGGLPDDPELRWLHDPAEAERLGMMVTVTQADMQVGELASGVDRLLALGVDWTLTPDQAAQAVDAHLRAHADEGRLGFVPQGAPTNSTGTTRSPFSTDITLAQQVLAPHNQPVAGADGAGTLTARALGIPSAGLATVAGADLREQAWVAGLLDTTWAATAGYYLTEMLDPVADDPEVEASLRHHVINYLRPGGPLPTLRVGAQPYGLLPVMPRHGFEPDVRRRAQADVARVSAAVRELAAPLVESVPRLAQVRRREDVDDVVLDLLRRTPVPWSLTFRKLIGPVERLAVSVYWDLIADFQRSLTAMLLARLQCYQLTQLSELTHDEREHPLHVPLVLRPDPTPDDAARQSTGYLAEIQSLLVEPDGADILDARQNSVALLEAFVAAAAVNENRRAGKRLVLEEATALQLSEAMHAYVSSAADHLPYAIRVETLAAAPAATGSDVGVPSTPRQFAGMVMPTLTGDRTIAQHVAVKLEEALRVPGSLDNPVDPLHHLQEMSVALGRLAEAPPDQLEWAFRGVLDLYSTRVDAWITSLATARLTEHRTSAPAGVHIGGWGVVEDLRPDHGVAAESAGFVHTPSLGHAASTAVLRSARASHRDEDGRLFDLDLTSRRVRQALGVLEGLGNGQRLAALLGYRVERGLQDRDLRLAQFILPLRQLCPLRSERPTSAHSEPVESVAARDVVDGLALLDRWADDRGAVLTAAGVPAASAPEVSAVLDDVASLADAVSDVLVGESVHQATLGNLERSGAALAAHDRQEPAPDPEFVRTPRAGVVLAHRVGLWLATGSTDPAPGWAADLRHVGEPRLDRWLGLVLGSPTTWKFSARLVHTPPPPADGGPAAAPSSKSLKARSVGVLELSALSLVLAARRPAAGEPSELEALIAAHYAASDEVAALAPGPDHHLELNLDGLALLLDLAAWAGEVVAAAPLTGQHLAGATDVRAGATMLAATVDVSEAVARADAVSQAVVKAAAQLNTAVTALRGAVTRTNERRVIKALQDLAAVEGPDVFPRADVALVVHAGEVLARVQARVSAAASVPVPGSPVVDETGDQPVPGQGEDPAVVRARAVLRVLLGNGQPFLAVQKPTATDMLAAAKAARKDLLAGDATAPATWVHRMALVRPQLDPMAALLVHFEAGGARVADQLQVLPVPHHPGKPWAGLPFGPDGPPPPGTATLVLHAPDGFDPQAGGAGVMVDTWTESVPVAEETTAVTFHYDAPGARAPQAMLLAVHPALDPDRWDFDTLLGCVQEAVDLARLRTLGSRELAPFATLVPGLFLPEVYTRDTAGVRLRELATNAAAAGVGGLVHDFVIGKK